MLSRGIGALILSEQTSFSGSNLVAGSLWRYIGVGLAITFVTFVPAILIVSLLTVRLVPFANVDASILIIGMLLACLGAIIIALRLSLLLPARAVGDQNMTFAEAWYYTRGNAWRLFWGLLACTLPLMVAWQILLWVLVGSPTPLIFSSEPFSSGVLMTNALSPIVYLLTWPVAIGFLSLSYLHFFGRYSAADGVLTR